MPNEKILLVDDEDTNLRLLTQWLIPLGYNIELASNGEEAVQKVRDSRPDLIILDIMMPVMDGYEVCKRLKQDPETKNIPIIMVTALHERKSKLKGLSVCANDFLSKPINQRELTIRVKNLLKIKAFDDFMLRHNEILAKQVREKNQDIRNMSNEMMRRLMAAAKLSAPIMNNVQAWALSLAERYNVHSNGFDTIQKFGQFFGYAELITETNSSSLKADL